LHSGAYGCMICRHEGNKAVLLSTVGLPEAAMRHNALTMNAERENDENSRQEMAECRMTFHVGLKKKVQGINVDYFELWWLVGR
ncbi:MAG: hypothetical protein J6S48_02415, partial [Bacteroidales bacterium]|nr:hypothetical protein [Bacteroidales bacterium]